jgi:hypothetical protein
VSVRRAGEGDFEAEDTVEAIDDTGIVACGDAMEEEHENTCEVHAEVHVRTGEVVEEEEDSETAALEAREDEDGVEEACEEEELAMQEADADAWVPSLDVDSRVVCSRTPSRRKS